MAFLSNRNVFLKQLLSGGFGNKKREIILNSFNMKRLISTDGISDTTLLMQDGRIIQELPLVIERVSTNKAAQILLEGQSNAKESQKFCKPLEKEELQAMLESFRGCNSFMEIFRLIEIVPPSSVQPEVAYEILKRLIEIEQVYSTYGEMVSTEEASTKYIKPVVIKFLMGVILSNKQLDILICCLRTMNQSNSFKNYVQTFENELHDIIMLNVTQNKFNVSQICEIVKEFRAAGYSNQVDKLWVGIVDNAESITNYNILKLYQVLPYFKASRNVVANALLDKMSSLWWTMEGRDLAEILTITKQTRTHSYKLLQILGRWLNTKIHSISEDELLIMINGFSNVDFVNTQVTSALERYVKVRGDHIKNSFLFAGIMDYCLQFRIRSPTILEKACDYFIAKRETLPPVVMKSLFLPFGHLNYTPTRSYEFWKTFEQILEEKFSYFSPEHILDILMSCVYLDKYPINFVNNVFDPYFLNRLQISCKKWPVTRKQLILFDHIMTTECKSYKGPMLLREAPVSTLFTDERIKFVLSKLRESLVEMVGSADRVLFNKCLRTCPVQSMCTVDILLVPEDAKMPYLGNFTSSKNPYVGILIQLPEHYTLEDDHLIGSQAMRKRHIEKLGIAVVSLTYLHLIKLSSQPGELIRYVTDSIEEAESSFRAKETFVK